MPYLGLLHPEPLQQAIADPYLRRRHSNTVLSHSLRHAKMGTIKDRSDMDLTEAEDIKKRWQEYTELYKKDLHDPDNHHGVITHLEPDILE